MQRAQILFVDDEPEHLALGADLLEEAGFQVARASNADIALLLIKERVPFDVMVTDVVMPGTLDGFALADLARALLPRLPVIYTTGFAHVAKLRARGAIYGEILEKPYSADALINAVRIACGSRAVPAAA